MENVSGQNTKTKIKRDIKKCRCCPKHFIYDKGEDNATGGKWYYCRQAVERESSGMRQIEYENYDIPDDCYLSLEYRIFDEIPFEDRCEVNDNTKRWIERGRVPETKKERRERKKKEKETKEKQRECYRQMRIKMGLE